MTLRLSLNTLEKIDETFIAFFVLERLGFPVQPLKPTSHTKGLNHVLHTIEAMEHTWSFKLANQSKAFGQKVRGEMIKLWSVNRKTAGVLEGLVTATKAKRVLEIGTSAGYSTLFLANGAMHNHGKVFTIEALPEKILLAKKHFKQSGLKNITLLEGNALKILKTWKRGSVDFVFLDADKENYGNYLRYLLPIMKVDALIVADNINDYGHMMEDYLQRVTGTHLPKSRVDKRVKSYYLAALDNGLMVTRKISNKK
jgi:predicted O-methyltransferase YrrM